MPKEYNIKELEKQIQKGDFYSKDCQTKEILIIRKSILDDLKQTIYKDVFNDCDIQDVRNFIMGIMRDLIVDEKFIKIPAKEFALSENQGQQDNTEDKGNTSPSLPPRKKDESLEGGYDENSLAPADDIFSESSEVKNGN